MDTIVNKVAKSGLITLDLADYLPEENSYIIFDLKPFLFRELILKEKDFRTQLKDHDWKRYEAKCVSITCSTDAIIPMWAYMLVATYLQPVAGELYVGTEIELVETILLAQIESLDISEFQDKRIVIKGCGDRPVPASAYVAVMKKFQPVVKSLMFGEPCSTVPVYKQKRPQ